MLRAMIYHNQGEHANHYTTDGVLMVYHVTQCFVCEVYKAKHIALRSKSKDWLATNRDSVSAQDVYPRTAVWSIWRNNDLPQITDKLDHIWLYQVHLTINYVHIYHC
jgi:hypothetical protein